MTVYLTVWDDFSGKFVGNLEMRATELNGKPLLTYEFVGSGSQDGGTWTFVSNGNTEIELTSNLRKGVVAALQSTRWGKVIPPEVPWFKDSTGHGDNRLLYFGLDGQTRHCSWGLKK